MINRARAIVLGVLACVAVAPACAGRRATTRVAAPRIIAHGDWQATPPLGYAADGTRRNVKAGDSLTFRTLVVIVLGTTADSSATPAIDVVRLRLAEGATRDEISAREGAAFRWQGYHIAIVGVYGPGELGNGLVALEVATLASLPANVLSWWDVPYHYLIDLDGRIYEGRDWHFMGETNTTYDPAGHFLISVIGNYGRQEPTKAQLEAIADLMAWALSAFDLPIDRIGGHYNYADTDCPGKSCGSIWRTGHSDAW